MELRTERLVYLIGRFPAANHGYLLEEIKGLRRLGIRVAVASVSSSDRPPDELAAEEREEAQSTFYLKRQAPLRMLADVVTTAARRPLRCMRGMWWALKLARGIGATHNAGFYFAEAVILGRWMQKGGATHVHAHFSSLIALIAQRIFPISYSFTVHGYGELYDPSGFHLREKIGHALFVRAISQHGRSQLMLAAPPECWGKLVYCPLGVDWRRLPPVKRATAHAGFEVACVGRLAPEKGQVFLLHALGELAEAGRRVHLHLYGDGPDRARLQTLAVSLGIADAVTFHGWTAASRLLTEYERIDCLAVPSLYEGIPVVLMEAMALGIPCIAPRITGVPELVQEMSTGLLFSAGDSSELARAITRLMDSPALGAALALKAREFVRERYDTVKNTSAFAALLSSRVGPGIGGLSRAERARAAIA